MNICRTREKSANWNGPCLEFFESNLKQLMADHVESEIELCKQLMAELEKSIKEKYFRLEDVDFSLKQMTSLQLDFSKKPPNSSEIGLEREANEYICALIVLATGQILNKSAIDSPSDFEESQDSNRSPSPILVRTSDAHSILKHLSTIYENRSKHKDGGDSIKHLLCSLPHAMPTFLCNLPDQMLLRLLKIFCNTVLKDSTSFEIDECDHLRDTIASTIIVRLICCPFAYDRD